MIHCVGAFSGVIEAEPSWTVEDLKRSIAQRLCLPDGSSDVLKLISGGKTLQHGLLSENGVSAESRVLVMQGKAARPHLLEQEERIKRLEKLKEAARKMSKRGDRYSSIDTYELELENQDGMTIKFENEADQQSLMMGLALQQKGATTMRMGKYREALDELLLAEEAFLLCNPAHLPAIDNTALLMLDIVWCLFKLGEVSQLAAASARLAAARRGLERSYGANMERLRVLHGNFQPELATYVRLECLEGVAAFHSGNTAEAQCKLQAAEAKYSRLQLSDDDVAAVAGMGFSTTEARRALRFCDSHKDAAVAFLLETKKKQQAQRQKDKEHYQMRKKQRKFGETVRGQYVQLEGVKQLVAMGYEERLAAEALRQSDNDCNAALDILSDPSRYETLQLQLAGGAAKGKHKLKISRADVAQCLAMGFSEVFVRKALSKAGGDVLRAIDLLVSYGDEAKQVYEDVHAAGSGTCSAPDEGGAASSSGAAAGAAASVACEENGEGAADEEEAKEVDAEVENELATAVMRDPLSSYDVDVEEEGAALQHYLALLDSMQC